jgi:hypothetical protein
MNTTPITLRIKLTGTRQVRARLRSIRWMLFLHNVRVAVRRMLSI